MPSGADNNYGGQPANVSVRIRKNNVTLTENAACMTGGGQCRAEVQFRNKTGVTDLREALRARLRVDDAAGDTLSEGRRDLSSN